MVEPEPKPEPDQAEWHGRSSGGVDGSSNSSRGKVASGPPPSKFKFQFISNQGEVKRLHPRLATRRGTPVRVHTLCDTLVCEAKFVVSVWSLGHS